MYKEKKEEKYSYQVRIEKCWYMRNEVNDVPDIQSLHEPLSIQYSPRWISRYFFFFFSYIFMYVTTQVL